MTETRHSANRTAGYVRRAGTWLGPACTGALLLAVSATEAAPIPPLPGCMLVPDTIVVVASTEFGRRSFMLGSSRSRPDGVRFLVGGDGVRGTEQFGAHIGAPSRVTDIVLGAGIRAHLWSARDGALEATLATPQELRPRDQATVHRLVYLQGEPLVRGEPVAIDLGGERQYACVTPGSGGCVTLSTAGDLRGVALLFGAVDPDVWVRLGDVSLEGRHDLHVPDGRAVALVVRRSAGAGEVRLRLDPGGDRDADREGGGRFGSWWSILADDGEPDSHWGQISSPRHTLVKRLPLHRAPDTIESARATYHIGYRPYFRAERTHEPSPERIWSDLVVEVNGHTILRERLDVAGTIGWHHIDIEHPERVLRRGENDVRFRVDGPDYVYLSVDTDTNEGRSGILRHGRFDSSTLRPDREVSGEYLVRLEIR